MSALDRRLRFVRRVLEDARRYRVTVAEAFRQRCRWDPLPKREAFPSYAAFRTFRSRYRARLSHPDGDSNGNGAGGCDTRESSRGTAMNTDTTRTEEELIEDAAQRIYDEVTRYPTLLRLLCRFFAERMTERPR